MLLSFLSAPFYTFFFLLFLLLHTRLGLSPILDGFNELDFATFLMKLTSAVQTPRIHNEICSYSNGYRSSNKKERKRNVGRTRFANLLVPSKIPTYVSNTLIKRISLVDIFDAQQQRVERFPDLRFSDIPISIRINVCWFFPTDTRSIYSYE